MQKTDFTPIWLKDTAQKTVDKKSILNWKMTKRTMPTTIFRIFISIFNSIKTIFTKLLWHPVFLIYLQELKQVCLWFWENNKSSTG